ncbi:group III truncated hemoglobin [Aquimarina agarilytica]|uniref:group III truncated hemoglobin n=1 Tax=Aquimarina agarilytica TaxID=1087449 RepID=UPI000288A682|nr:group III truncated hemoglobin [Aquimarina agarilytica]
MTDIQNRTDLELIFNSFYKKAIADASIGYFFTEIIPIDLETHLPIILDFWEYNLFHKGTYSKNLLEIHKNIHVKSPMQYAHFDQWIHLLNETVDNHFSGLISNKLKTNALSIATVMKTKVV